MSHGLDALNDDPIPWLLEPDTNNPGVRYLTLTEILGHSADAPPVRKAQRAVMTQGPVPVILDAQDSEGYWSKPGAGYSPKYRSTVWQIIFLAQLGVDPTDNRVRRGCEYLLGHTIGPNHAFSVYQSRAPRGALHCLNGNLLDALLRLGYAGDARVQAALDWQARAITGEGEMEYYRSGTAGPGFACGINLEQPCGWGATKAIKALAAVPPEYLTPAIERGIEAGAEFLLSRDLSIADYPYTGRVSPTWFKFGFPLSYWSDVLESAALLVDLGYGHDPRLANVLRLILSKQDDQGRWKLENTLNRKMWGDIEAKGKPSKWVTLRAIRVLKRMDAA